MYEDEVHRRATVFTIPTDISDMPTRAVELPEQGPTENGIFEIFVV